MEKPKSPSCVYFEHLLWKNELEYNRRELAIFESFLMSKGASLSPSIYKEYMGHLHELLRTINRIMAELQFEKRNLLVEKRPASSTREAGNVLVEEKIEVCYRYLREEMFYYEQDYCQFRKQFCGLVGSLESV